MPVTGTVTGTLSPELSPELCHRNLSPTLDEWLKRRALKSNAGDGSRCFVVCFDKTVIGYYGLSVGAIAHEAAPKPMRRNMPDPLPALLLGRLAVDHKYHNRGIGSALLRDAILRSLNIARDACIFAMLIHALHDKASAVLPLAGFRAIAATTDDA